MKSVKIILFILVGLSTIAAQSKSQKNLVLKTQEDSISYSIGQSIGKNLKDPNIKVNFDVVIQGMKDELSGKSILTETQMQNILMAFNQRLMAIKNEQINSVKEKNKKEGDAFLAENKTKEGVITLPSGLQYKVLATGNGPIPKETDKVKVHYKGTLIDGTVFDSSYDRGEPAVFGVTQVIKGWVEALQVMHIGDKWQLFIPSDLAYGETGAGNVISPNSVLVFDVELIEIVK